MRSRTRRLLLIIELVLISAAATALAAAAAVEPAAQPEHFTGSLVNTMAGARFSQPFILSVDRFASDADLQRLAGILAARGPYFLRDELWKENAGYLRIGGRIGYPIAAVFAQETPAGRSLRVVLNRPLSSFEVAHYTRSSKYPFSVVELNLDKNGKGEGHFIAAAKMQLEGKTLEIESLGVQPLRLLAVRED
jgi:hypothetical protein